MSFKIKFSYLICVANLSLVPISKPFWSRLVELFETVTPPSKRMERQTTPYIAGQTSLHKSLSRPQEKSRITTKITVPKSLINFTPNTCASAAGTVEKNEKNCLKFCLFGFPEVLVMGSATTTVRKVVLSSTLIGPFKIWARAQIQRPLAFALKFKS